jgi:hypothetical protein
MKRTEALIKGLVLLNEYADCEVWSDNDIIFAGSGDHRVQLDSHANALEELGWYATDEGWAFNL